MSLLEIRDLRLVYPNGNEVLKKVSLTAEAGEIIAVIGRSGAGKSTLLRCINGLERATSGTVILDGEDITALDEQQFAPGTPAHRLSSGRNTTWWSACPCLPTCSQGDWVMGTGSPACWATSAGRIARSPFATWNALHLLHRANQRADHLSGGEKQRVSIARAISQQPKIILADEPVASLDPQLSQQVMSDLARVAREDRVLTLISIHQVSLVHQFADRVIGLAQGPRGLRRAGRQAGRRRDEPGLSIRQSR